MKKFYNVDYEEQETIINIDYCKKELYLYSSRNAVCNRIIGKIGEPTRKYYTQQKVSGAMWVIPFQNKKIITSILSRPILIGNMK